MKQINQENTHTNSGCKEASNNNSADSETFKESNSSNKEQRLLLRIPSRKVGNATNGFSNVESTTTSEAQTIQNDNENSALQKFDSNELSTRISKSQSAGLLEATAIEEQSNHIQHQVVHPTIQRILHQTKQTHLVVSSNDSLPVHYRHLHASKQSSVKPTNRPLTIATSQPSVTVVRARRASHPACFVGNNWFHNEQVKQNPHRQSALISGISAKEVHLKPPNNLAKLPIHLFLLCSNTSDST